MSENALRFENIELASGDSGAREGHGLKRTRTYYVTDSHYGIGTTANDTLNDDYYIVYNTWPVLSGSNSDGTNSQSGTDLEKIGISTLTTAVKGSLTKDHGLDCIIVRKADRKAVRLTIESTTHSHYKTINSSNTGTTIKEITTFDGLYTPELGRLRNQGQI